MNITANNIRNIAVIGHSGEGKTTLCEAMLFNGGMIERMGKIADGSTAMDFDEIEKLRKMSVYTSVSYLVWKGVKINVLDLPGFYDFEGERAAGLAASGGAVLVIGAAAAIPIGAESVIDYCLKQRKPLVIFINGMDKDTADYMGAVEALREKYRGKIAPIQIPIMSGGKMTGYINALQNKAYKFSSLGPQEIDIPAEYELSVSEMKSSLMETAAENDDILLEKYFDNGSLSPAETIQGIRMGIATVNTIPVMAGSAVQNRGVINLLDEIVRYMPTADERRNALATNPTTGKVINITCSEDGPFAAKVFKTVIDPYAGKLSYIKIFRGSIATGDMVLNADTGETERIGQLYFLRGKKNESVDRLTAGDIGAVAKLASTATNHTLCSPSECVKMADIRFAKPTISLAARAEDKGEEDKMIAAFNRIKEEDLTFSTEKRSDTGEFVLNGQGETQLGIIAQRVRMRYGVNIILAEPRIPYKETIRSVAVGEGKHKKQSGGHGQYGHCKIRFEPCEGDFAFAEEVVGGAVPKQYFPAVEKGLAECMQRGVLAGYPVTGVKAVLFDGSFHEVDSSEAAFKAAAAIAFKEGIKAADPVLLEPIMRLKVATPSEYMGGIMGDLIKRRGRISQTTNESDDMVIISAEVPLAEITKYTTDLRALTQGKGKFGKEFLDYEEVPANIAEQIIESKQ